MRWYLGNIVLLGLAGLGMAWSPNLLTALAWGDPARHRRRGVHQRLPTASPSRRARRTCAAGCSAFTAVAFLGSTPIGGPITGLVGDRVGAEWALAYGSVDRPGDGVDGRRQCSPGRGRTDRTGVADLQPSASG